MSQKTELRDLQGQLRDAGPTRLVTWLQDPCGGDAFTSRQEPDLTLTNAQLAAWCDAHPDVQAIVVRRVGADELRRDDS